MFVLAAIVTTVRCDSSTSILECEEALLGDQSFAESAAFERDSILASLPADTVVSGKAKLHSMSDQIIEEIKDTGVEVTYIFTQIPAALIVGTGEQFTNVAKLEGVVYVDVSRWDVGELYCE